MVNSLWGNDFVIPSTKEVAKKTYDKINKPKKIKVEKSPEQKIKSKTTSLEDRLKIINEEVNKVLGHYKENTLVIRTKDQLVDYINKAVANKIIAIDTETNNSLDPVTCKLMGPCIYTPGMKNAYIPINHINRETQELLENQVTEQDIYEQFSRLNGIEIITHNGKFDYEVLHCTTGWDMPITWDTMIGARLLNENERAGLKQQYIEKINPDQEKYSIDHLFENVEYAVVNPDVFALYAATDAYMTYELYLYQKKLFEDPANKRVYDLFKNIEVPVITVVAKMEMNGVCLDEDYCKRLSVKYHKKLDDLNAQIDVELQKITSKIIAWRNTDDAIKPALKKDGTPGGKSKSEQLADPPEVTSPTQLAILLYDVLKVTPPDKKNPRGTGEEVLKEIKIPLTDLILEQRGLLKLINAFIDALPELRSPKDHRIHSHFNQMGTDTGRFSCSEP